MCVGFYKVKFNPQRTWGLNIQPHTQFTQVYKSCFIYLCVREFIVYIFSCLGEDIVILMPEVEDLNAMYVFAFKGTHAAYLNLNLQ